MLQVLLKALFDLGARLEIRRTFKIAKFKNPIFRKIKNLITFLFLSYNNHSYIFEIFRQNCNNKARSKSDIATGRSSGANLAFIGEHTVLYL